MAEKRFIKGLFKDTAPLDQPEGSWRYARNMLLNKTDGAVSNEGGTELSGYLGDLSMSPDFVGVGDQSAKVIGKIEVDNDKIILFLVNKKEQDSVTIPVHSCEIGIWKNGLYKTLYKPQIPISGYKSNTNLNFNTSNPIEGTYKINPKEDLIIYWTDDLNPPKAFNISRQERWIAQDTISSPQEWLYGIDPSTSHEDHINLLNLFPHSGPVPHIKMHDIYWVTKPYQKSITTGGGLLTAVYYLAVAYIDDDFVSTNYLSVSNPVSIVEDYDHTKPRHKKDGAKHATQTTKAIKWVVTNLNTDYKYLSPVIVRKMGDATEAFKLNVVEVTPDVNGRVEIVFSGLEGFTPSSVKDVIIDTISYDTAKTLNQLDNVLYLGNLKGKKDLGYQKYANAIGLKSEVKTFDKFDTFYATIDNLTTGFGESEVDVYNGLAQDVQISQSYRYIPNATEWKGYQRDEVYAFYISFILRDGSMSYAYHIPGREQLVTQLEIDGNANTGDYSLIKESSTLTNIGGSAETAVSGGSDDLGALNVIYKDLQRLSPSYAKNFHFFDFSKLSGARNMNYWENATETYPHTDEYEIWDEHTHIDINGITQFVAGDIRGTKVRHHHFPANSNSDRGVFNLLPKPNGTGAPQSGYLCESAPTEGPVNPRPWKTTFKAYVKYSDEGIKPATHDLYLIANNIWAGFTICDPSPADMDTLIADHSSIMGRVKAAAPFGGTITSSNSQPGATFEQDEVTQTLIFEDKYPFSDPSIVDHDNVLSYSGSNTPSVVTSEQASAFDALWHNDHFKADQKMTVKVKLKIDLTTVDDNPKSQFYIKIHRSDNTWNTVNFGSISHSSDAKAHWCACEKHPSASSHSLNREWHREHYQKNTSEKTLNLDIGDKFYVMAFKPWHVGSVFSGTTYADVERFPYSSKCDWRRDTGHAAFERWSASKWAFQSELQFRIESAAGPVLDEMLSDVKLRHSVNALGFTLDNIKIPKSIADQVQGFRIYHAKRGHSDKTILGQAPSFPMRPDSAIIGICSESLANTANIVDAQFAMQTESEIPQTIIRKEPWANGNIYYPQYDNIYYGSEHVASAPYGTNRYYGHKYFSYYDFHLLRTKNSLAGATHIKPIYNLQNYTWQGATTNQPKKMVSKVTELDGTTPKIKKIEEEWGYGVTFNCYGKDVKTAVFMGGHYNPVQTRDCNGWSNSFKPFSLPRVLNQKAISYLKGDSIFRAEALGFGGTIVNERGDSAIIYGLMDNHELSAYENKQASGCSFWSFWGGYNSANPFLLVANPVNAILDDAGDKCNLQSYTNIDNLSAFKTDVYKSIDDQDLIFTGFEVVGRDIDNFIFWDKEAIDLIPSGSGISPTIGDALTFKYKNLGGGFNQTTAGADKVYQADYSIYQLQSEIQRDSNGYLIPEHHGRWHIFGGDTFICRYGFMNGYAPRDSRSPAIPKRGLHYYIVESPDNINLRHIESDESLYFPGTSAKEILDEFHDKDFTHSDNIKYNDNYSAVNDIRPAFPLPIRESKQDSFSTRTHRSVTSDPTSVIDNYRIFKANQFKDLPKHRGELWKLSTFNNLLYFHMEESLYAAKGKQQMQMKDGSDAFIGSGDIFQQDPDELIQTDGGYGGTQSQWAGITTRFGYFFVDAKSNKIFLMKDKLLEISAIGMEAWFKDNLPFQVAEYGYANCATDNPIQGMGFHSVYDPKHKRIILTKREFTVTEKFINGYNSQNVSGPCGQINPEGLIRFFSDECTFKRWGKDKNGNCVWTDIPMSCAGSGSSYFNCSGWTISYYTELGVWGSFHDYIPYIYFNTSTEFYSLTDIHPSPIWCTNTMVSAGVCLSVSTATDYVGTTYGNAGIWKHNSSTKGILYQENLLNFSTTLVDREAIYYPFEIEVIHNETKSKDSLTAAFNYTLETFNSNNLNVLEHGFTKFYLYNTFQISANTQDSVTSSLITGTNLEYLVNIRRIGNNWKVNNFRDMAALTIDASPYYMSTNTNIIGGINTGTITTSDTESMFIISGMSETINSSYIDLGKEWNEQKKFIDKWIGIRLIYDNISNNLLNLYSTDVVTRKIHR